MKLKHRWCPKGCREPGNPHRKRQLMRIISTPKKHRYNTGRGATRYDLLLDWFCPECRHTEPVNSKDIRDSSRKTSSSLGPNHHREAYGLKTVEVFE